LKEMEEMKYSALHDVKKIEHDIRKARELNPKKKTRITSEITPRRTKLKRNIQS
jgi:hypothetical protein